jgi:gamma-glutamyltranspeptidase/glutathione hydrolase
MLGDRKTRASCARRSEVIAANGMVATSQPLATQVGLDLLKAGGSAVDAAIATNAMLALTEPTGCGLGGDLFAIVWDAETKRLFGLNGSGRAPRSLTLDLLRKRGELIPNTGPLPVTAPGCVDAWFELHRRFGKLPMRDVLDPAIGYARAGFPLSEVIARHWARSAAVLKDQPGFAAQFLLGGRSPRKGEIFRNQNLASTLERIVKGGRDVFYTGEIARAIDAFMRRHAGYLSFEDLQAHRSEWVDPVSTRYRGYSVWELPPNGQGIAVLQILNLLEAWKLCALGFGSADYVHMFVESKKLAFEDRARWCADPAFHEIPIARLISKEYAAERRKLIDEKRAAMSYEAGSMSLRAGDTVCLCTADSAGNMVSLMQSNYRGMGSGMAPDGLGFVLQDRGELFSLDPDSWNAFAPGKRPFHTVIPAFVTREGERWLAFGVMGGEFQPVGQVQILVNLIDFGMDFQEAGDAPRFGHEGSSEPTGERMEDGGELNFEDGFDPKVIEELERRGHRIGDSGGHYGGYQAVGWDEANGVWIGASESRKDGCAAGY